MNNLKTTNGLLLIAVLSLFISCTKLDEKLGNALTPDQANASATASGLLQSAYNSINPALIDQAGWWALAEHTSDEICGPTRATNWDDNGVWRVLHQHKYDANHSYITATFENLLIMQYNASNVLNFSPSAKQAAEARFLRAFSMYCVLSGWGQVPFRDHDVPLSETPTVMKDSAALNFIISELNAVISDLPTHSSVPSTEATQDAAKFLLMKCYLNKGTYTNRSNPTFNAADMQQVISLADQLTGYSLTSNYYDNFSPTSSTASTEMIWGFISHPASDNGNNVRSRWYCTLNYHNNPGGWNGFCTLSDFYDKFENGDIRKKADYPGLKNQSGLNAGFLIGQQYDKNGNPINESASAGGGPALSFSAAINPSLQETDPNTLDITGIRVLKFVPDYDPANVNDPANELPFFRYSDVLLMKAEAQLRTNNSASALTIVNGIRTARGASKLASLTTANLLDERGRELYDEAWRREDQIRFGTFLQPNQAKPYISDAAYLLFPIPANDLAADPNLVQNPGF